MAVTTIYMLLIMPERAPSETVCSELDNAALLFWSKCSRWSVLDACKRADVLSRFYWGNPYWSSKKEYAVAVDLDRTRNCLSYIYL